MKTVSIHASRHYEVRIEAGLLDRAGALLRSLSRAETACVVSGEHVNALYGDRLQRSLAQAGFRVLRFAHPSGEKYKNLETYGKLLDFLARKGLGRSDLLISLGGGAIMRKENVRSLQHNGAIFFIDRSPEYLVPTGDRPLADKKEKIMRLYNKRIDTYMSTADFIIDGDCDPEDVADSIINGE